MKCEGCGERTDQTVAVGNDGRIGGYCIDCELVTIDESIVYGSAVIVDRGTNQ